MKNWRIAKRFRVKKNKLGISAETAKSVFPDMVGEERDSPSPRITVKEKHVSYEPGLRIPEVSYLPEPYVEPTDKEMIEGLYESERPEEAFRLEYLKKENTVLKGKLTKMTKKANAYKDDLDRANGVVKQLIREKYGETQ